MASEAVHEPVATSAPVVAPTEAPAETAPKTTTETAPETTTEVAPETTPAPATTTEEPAAAAPIKAPTETVVETATESASTETEAPKTEEAKKTEETPATGLVLHHLEHSRSQRVLWLLEELEAPYSIKVYKRTPQRRAPPELKKISPLGKAPVVTDGDDTIAESAAVMEYILEKYGNGKLQPPAAGKLTDRYYLHYAEGSLMPLLGMRIVTSFIPPKAPLLIRPIARGLVDGLNTNYISPELKAHLEMIEKHLAKSPTGWFAGGEEPTLCDFMMILPLEAIAATSHGKTETLGPATAAFVKKCHSRPAYLRALEKGEADYHYGPKNSKL